MRPIPCSRRNRGCSMLSHASRLPPGCSSSSPIRMPQLRHSTNCCTKKKSYLTPREQDSKGAQLNMSTVEINQEVSTKLDEVRIALGRAIVGTGGVCLTNSFQAEDVLLTKLALELDPNIPVLFLDTGYHFRETYDYRDRIAREWRLNLINLLPE